MIKSSQEDNWKIQIENERKDQSICGTINIKFKFQEDYQLEYNLEDCLIENHYFDIDDQKEDDKKEFVRPSDLNINYCYSNEQGEKIQLDIKDYEMDDISDFNCSVNYENEGISSFFVQYIVISPNHQFIFISVDVQILGKLESNRLIVIDIKNQKMKKLFYRSHFLVSQKPQFSKDGNVAIINISKNEEGTRYLFFDLKNGIQNISIFQFEHYFRRIDYDDKSKCFYYITQNGKIIKQPINFEDYTIDKSKSQKFKICPILNEYLEYNIRFYLLYDSIGLLLDELGQFLVIRMGKNCKVIRNYFYEYHYPVFIFNKAFVVTSDYNQNKLLFMDVLKGKLIRSREFTQIDKYQYYYPRKQSYFISYLYYCPQEENSDFEIMELQQQKRPQWMIFDFIRGIEKEVNQTKLTQERIKRQIFTHDFVAQSYQNKLSFQLKL